MSRVASVPGWVDPLFRFCAAGVTAWFVYRMVAALLLKPDRLILMILLVSETISLITIILARRPTFRDVNPAYMVLTTVASFLVPLFITVQDNSAVIPEWAGDILSASGLAWTIYAKISLGRSFGLLAARRVIKIKGAYRFVRHPIYVGYFVAHLAFLLTNFNYANLIILVCLYCMQLMRALREEKILSDDPAYLSYCEKTPYRFVYGVF